MHKLSENWAIVATIDPDSYTTGTTSSDEVDMSDFHDLMVVIQSGDIASTGTLNGTLLTGAVTGTVATTLKTMTEFTDDDDDKQVILYARGVDFAAGHRFAKLNLVVTGTVEMSAVLLGQTKFGKASSYDLATVDEIVTTGN